MKVLENSNNLFAGNENPRVFEMFLIVLNTNGV
jgi:hypothetical protein